MSSRFLFRALLSRNYRLIVAPRKFDVLKTMDLKSTFKCRDCVNLFSTLIGLEPCLGETCTDSIQFKKKIRKIYHFVFSKPDT